MSEREKIKTTVDIFGHKYTIVGREDVSHVRLVANHVDNKMREINNMNPYLDTNKLAVLTAVNAVNEYLKLEKELEELKQIIKKREEQEIG